VKLQPLTVMVSESDANQLLVDDEAHSLAVTV
jgi:hypothetical protein